MYQVEHTDTFGGEANYCWCRRYDIEAKGKSHKGETVTGPSSKSSMRP
jgi:hypothetical protein